MILGDVERMIVALIFANVISFFVTLILTAGRSKSQIELNNALRSKDIDRITTA
jgi:hypothetical protein